MPSFFPVSSGYLLPNYFTVLANFVNATWNTVASHEIAVVTGLVHVMIIIECDGTLTDAADGASIQFGFEGATNTWIASTGAAGAGGSTIDDDEIWSDNTPLDKEGTTSSVIIDKVINGLDIGYEITGAALTGGALRFHVYWEPLAPGSLCAEGAGGSL